MKPAAIVAAASALLLSGMAEAAEIQVLSTQAIDLTRPHPFTAAGNKEFNSFLWMPPGGKRGGHILLVDSTVFTTLFGGTDSLKQFWLNVAGM